MAIYLGFTPQFSVSTASRLCVVLFQISYFLTIQSSVYSFLSIPPLLPTFYWTFCHCFLTFLFAFCSIVVRDCKSFSRRDSADPSPNFGLLSLLYALYSSWFVVILSYLDGHLNAEQPSWITDIGHHTVVGSGFHFNTFYAFKMSVLSPPLSRCNHLGRVVQLIFWSTALLNRFWLRKQISFEFGIRCLDFSIVFYDILPSFWTKTLLMLIKSRFDFDQPQNDLRWTSPFLCSLYQKVELIDLNSLYKKTTKQLSQLSINLQSFSLCTAQCAVKVKSDFSLE